MNPTPPHRHREAAPQGRRGDLPEPDEFHPASATARPTGVHHIELAHRVRTPAGANKAAERKGLWVFRPEGDQAGRRPRAGWWVLGVGFRLLVLGSWYCGGASEYAALVAVLYEDREG